MGIYINGSIFGIQIYNFNDDISNILFEKMYIKEMNDEQMKEAYLFYNNLNDKKVYFKIYTSCVSTLNHNNVDNFMIWYPLPLDIFLDKFCI